MRYFFDWVEGGKVFHDGTGIWCRSLDAARQQAMMALLEFARDTFTIGEPPREVGILVREETTGGRLRVSLTLQVEMAT